MKISVDYVCPHCGKDDHTVMYATDFYTVECHHCSKPIDLKLTNINKCGTEVESFLPIRECDYCDKEYLAQDVDKDVEVVCPHCSLVNSSQYIPPTHPMYTQKEMSKKDRVERFKEEVVKLCNKYSLSISFEDGCGDFIIDGYKKSNIERFKEAKVRPS